MAQTRSAKRQRTDSEDEAEGSQEAEEEAEEGSPPTRSEEYWFKEGNIVLQVENTQFRVHSSMLSRHSNIFKDMFDIPQPDQSEEPIVEGCPVVTLSDEVQDVEAILSIFYDNIKHVLLFLAYDKSSRISVSYLTAMLRLGRKYEIDYLLHEAVSRFHAAYPTQLKNWNFYCTDIVDDNYDDDVVPLEELINLAHEHSLNTVLPALYLRFTGRDRLILYLEPWFKTFVNEVAQHRLIMGREKLILYLHKVYTNRLKVILKNPAGTFPDCRSLAKCAPNQQAAFDRFGLWTNAEADVTNLCPWERPDLPLCSSCLKHLKAIYDDVRGETWQRLPTFFDLPKWGELKDEA